MCAYIDCNADLSQLPYLNMDSYYIYGIGSEQTSTTARLPYAAWIDDTYTAVSQCLSADFSDAVDLNRITISVINAESSGTKFAIVYEISLNFNASNVVGSNFVEVSKLFLSSNLGLVIKINT